jgi:hypothetical protein
MSGLLSRSDLFDRGDGLDSFLHYFFFLWTGRPLVLVEAKSFADLVVMELAAFATALEGDLSFPSLASVTIPMNFCWALDLAGILLGYAITGRKL